MSKTHYKTLVLSCAVAFFVLTGCDSTNKESTKSTLQIMGLTEGAVIEGDSSSRTLYFTYNFGKHGALNIHQLSEDSYTNNLANDPIEKNVGQFGLFALAHAQDSKDLLVYGDIEFNLVGTCGSQPLNFPKYGNMPTFNEENGKKSIDLSRNLQLPEFVRYMHSELNNSNSACYSLEEMEENPAIAMTQDITLRMDIVFNHKTKSGVSGKKEYTLYFKPSSPIEVSN